MKLDDLNKSNYSNSVVITSYVERTLQAPEVSIFEKYKDAFYQQNVLDVGCGAGRTSVYLRDFTSHYTGIDYSEKMIEYCKNQFPGLNFQCCDVRDLGAFSDGEFDFVLFSYNGLDYINNADRQLALCEIRRVLKKDGVFVFSTHNRNFKGIKRTPVLQYSLNPKNMFRNVVNYVTQVKNHKVRVGEEVESENYAVINDNGNNFSLLTYYIDSENQKEQLDDAGFELLEMYGNDGMVLKQDGDDSKNCWIYYVSN